MTKLINDFASFISQQPDCEEIDKIPLSPVQEAGKKADYFFYDREIICEQKNIENDIDVKIRKMIDELMSRKNAPRIYGTVNLMKIVSCFPDSKKIERRLFEIITSSIKNIFQSANRQIRTTKETFDLSDSKGVLLIINEPSVHIEPHHIIRRIAEFFAQKEEQNLRYDNINALWLIQPAHRLKFNAYPSIVLSNNILDRDMKAIEKLTAQIQKLDEAFSKYLKQPYIKGVTNFEDIKFSPYQKIGPFNLDQ